MIDISKFLNCWNDRYLENFDLSKLSMSRIFRGFENTEYSKLWISNLVLLQIRYPIQSITRNFGFFETFDSNKSRSSEMTLNSHLRQFFPNNNHFILVFDVTIILTILINCVFLALDDPVDELEYVFTAIYTLEVVIKVNM